MEQVDNRTFDLTFPMVIAVSKKKFKSLNLNIYRNLHHYELNFQKKKFKYLLERQIKALPKLGIIRLEYTIFNKTKRKLDTMNVGSVADKYFSDALVEFGIIEDDDYNYIVHHSFRFGGISDTSHIEVKIIEIERIKEEKPMRILLDQKDIQQALDTFVNEAMSVGTSTVKLSVEDGEITAEVIPQEDFFKSGAKATKTVKSRGGRPKGSKNKPKPAPEPKTEPEEVKAAKDDNTETSGSSGSGSDNSGSAGHSEEKTKTTRKVSTKTKTGDKKSKNLFGESDEESSSPKETTANKVTTTTNEDETPDSDTPEEKSPETVVVAKKEKIASIFGD